MLTVLIPGVRLPTLTDWGLFVRKLRTTPVSLSSRLPLSTGKMFDGDNLALESVKDTLRLNCSASVSDSLFF